jgi:flagellar biosynthesis anti-sigma factor FlgM
MLINSTIQSITGLYANQGASAMNRARGAKAAQSAPSDEVLLSSEAKNFSQAMGQLREMDDVRPEKVAYFQNLIAAGGYYVASENIASSMLQAR